MAKNPKVAWVIAGFFMAVGASFFPIFFYPLAHEDEYRQIQKVNRAGINQADVQPVGLKIWSDPFKPADK
ncbi:small integral membrane protein 20 [Austrofundulus limnaeus]|uniref:Small integral membrane protein 20 n=1 Tax=Austrofundulus limnaeus TaxID=52670 RepID=A0A2I4BV64_AUSLI|nr:PREDICTED: small integral membrane protein 20 [Austrofundulus limnaeus]